MKKRPIRFQPFHTLDMPQGLEVAAPGIVLSPLDHPGTHRVQDDVPRQLEEVRLPFHEYCLVSALENVSDSTVTPVEALGIRPVEAMHSPTEVWFRSLEQQMIVVRHQHPGVDAPPVGLGRRSEMCEQGSAIVIVEEDVLFAIAACGDVPDCAGVLKTQGTGHEPESSRPGLA
jgi:hypothetical protein